MKVTREYIEQCIIDGAREIMVKEGQLLRAFNLENGFYLNLSLCYEHKDENEIFIIPAKSICVNLTHDKSKVLYDYITEKVGDTLHIRTKHDAELASYYFAGLLNIID